MKDKSFILGIGSQRAGSTFLSRLLDKHPEVAIHPAKELHYFDTLFDIRSEALLKRFSGERLSGAINKICNAKDYKFVNPRWKWLLKSDFELFSKPIADIRYSNLFAEPARSKYLRRRSFWGEITPEYMLLDQTQVKTVKNTIGEDAFIFIMCRNPIKRMISSFRLIASLNFPSKSQEELDQIFMRLLNTENDWFPRHLRYNRYRQAYETYKTQFSKVLPLCFDDISQDPDHLLKQISDFLDLDYNSCITAEFFERKINALAIQYQPSVTVTNRLKTVLSPLEEDLADFLGRELILWAEHQGWTCSYSF